MNSAYFSFATTAAAKINSIVYSSKAKGGKQQTSRTLFKTVTTSEEPVKPRINKRKAMDERPIVADLGKKSCKVTTPDHQIAVRQSPQPSESGQASISKKPSDPAVLPGQNIQRALDQPVEINGRQYTRQEIARLTVPKLNQILRKEEDKEVCKFVRYLRRTEKNKGYSEKSRGLKIAKMQKIDKQIKVMQLEKDRLKSENNNLSREIKTINEKCKDIERLIYINKNQMRDRK
ncbi:bZIP transcription factor [Endozoicomonas acroporae]|uniref:bZIP transcription factor n=1 Tax=Endozoicomonas acroporae TaxID=1701104 RepID=UPI000C79481D|nr:bZIP transcription factor [Endozoicomonas acroporae]